MPTRNLDLVKISTFRSFYQECIQLAQKTKRALKPQKERRKKLPCLDLVLVRKIKLKLLDFFIHEANAVICHPLTGLDF